MVDATLFYNLKQCFQAGYLIYQYINRILRVTLVFKLHNIPFLKRVFTLYIMQAQSRDLLERKT